LGEAKRTARNAHNVCKQSDGLIIIWPAGTPYMLALAPTIQKRFRHMIKSYLFLIFTMSLSGCRQDNSALVDFEKDFINAANSDLKEGELDSLFVKYEKLIFPQQGTTQLMNNIKGIKTEYSPLIAFKDRQAYKDNIESLLNSENSMHRILAYITIGSAADTSYDDVLLERIKTETSKGCLTWAAMCLFYNHNKSTDKLLDFLVNNGNFGDAHFIPLYLQLDPTNLKVTSLKNINSQNKGAQIISLQTLSTIDKSTSVDSIVIQSIKTWDNDYKGYAIAALRQRDIEKFEILRPYLDNETTRNISIQVLEESKFQSDKDKIEKLKNEKKWD
jgi:hypothetical protein